VIPSRTQIDQAGRRIREAVRAGEIPPEDDVATVEDFRAAHLETTVMLHGLVGTIRASLLGAVKEVVADERAERMFDIASQPKTTAAIVAKLGRSTTRLTTMQDIAGARLVVPTLDVQNVAVDGMVSGLENEEIRQRGVELVRMSDFREHGDLLGYRAIHLIVNWRGRLGELQVRTIPQQVWAQSVELADQCSAPILSMARELPTGYSGWSSTAESFERLTWISLSRCRNHRLRIHGDELLSSDVQPQQR
jgi:ppGpp synthetase/RelA/SpoT-type nucleotidyltranferase